MHLKTVLRRYGRPGDRQSDCAMPMPSRLALAAAAIVALAAFSIPQIRKPISRFLSFSGPNAGDHADIRLPQINAALAAARPGFIFLAGDSHAELMGDGSLCGSMVVNGGSHGANTKLYASLLDSFDFKAAPSLAILIVGTNDIFTKSQPAEPRNLAEKVARVDSIAKTLSRISPRLVITPLPPIPPETTQILDLAALKALSEEEKRLCEQMPACQFVDPYKDLREASFGLARPEATADGLHIADYGKVRQALEAALCPAPILTSSRP